MGPGQVGVVDAQGGVGGAPDDVLARSQREGLAGVRASRHLQPQQSARPPATGAVVERLSDAEDRAVQQGRQAQDVAVPEALRARVQRVRTASRAGELVADVGDSGSRRGGQEHLARAARLDRVDHGEPEPHLGMFAPGTGREGLVHNALSVSGRNI